MKHLAHLPVARATRKHPLARAAGALLIGLTLGLGVVGCAGESETELLASAKSFIAKNDDKAAIIQLKNALQKNGDSPEARLLLGQAMLRLGDPRSAAVELRKARDLKADEDLVLPDLARAMLLSGEDDKVSAQFSTVQLRSPEARAKLATQIASAYMVRGDADKTLTYARQALEALPTHTPAITVEARVLASKGDLTGAMALLEGALQREPAHLEAGIFRGDILRAQPDGLPKALAQYQEVLAKHPEALAAHSAVISTLLLSGQKEAATAALQTMQKIGPGHPDALFYESQLAYEAGKYTTARELNERVLRMVPDSVRVLELSAATNYRLQDYAQAEQQLNRALKLSPGQALARHMLTQIYLRTGQPDNALEVLKPLLEAPKVSAQTLALAGEIYLLQGDAARSEEAFAAAAKIVPEDVRLRTSLAMSQLARSNGGAEAMRTLEALSAEDSSPRADVALVSARLNQKDYGGALKALEALEKKQPERALAHYLRARVLLLQKDDAGARNSFETALKKEPKFLPAAASLAALDLGAGQRSQARARLQAMVDADPANPSAHLALAEVASRAGASAADVSQLLRNGVKANANDPRPHVALVSHLLASGDNRAALTAAQTAAAALPADSSIQDALGRAQLANGDTQQALSTWRALASKEPRQPQFHLRLAEVLAGNKNWDEADNSLKRALQLQPGLIPAERARVLLAIQRGRPEDGLPVAREVQKRQPKDAIGWILEGDVEAARKNTAAALAAFRTATQRNAPTEAAIRLHHTLQAAGQTAEADSFAAQWQKAQPKDGTFRYYLGDTALARKDLAAAEMHYRAVLEAVPDNPMAMNNIAWIMATQGKPGAVALATKANELMPDRAPLLDTLALALAAEGQMAKAIETQKKALDQAPNSPAMKLALAKLYVKSGDKALARAELEEIANLGDKFAQQAEVSELLKQVR
jgi:putative PEP-CTERM system TPR-repeat lipoprotein